MNGYGHVSGQAQRIARMERTLDEAGQAVAGLAAALERYAELRGQIRELEAYYAGPEWKRDFADDEAGKLPSDLKRGVLSEDAVFDLLSEEKEMLRRMGEIADGGEADGSERGN